PSPFSYYAEQKKGLIQIRVTGSFPVVKESPLSNVLGAPSYTLPTDCVTLAKTLASSSLETEPPGTEPNLWDIHGTPGAAPEGEETEVGSGGNPALGCTSGHKSHHSSPVH